MQKTALNLVALGCIVCFSAADASAIGKVTALQSSAWVEQDNNKNVLRSDSELKVGDRIVTSDNGRVEMQLWSNATVRLYANADIRFRAKQNTESSTPGNQPLLYVHKGKVCVEYKPPPGSQGKFELNIGNTYVTVKHHQSYICVLREDGWSFVNLGDGSVQVSHSIDPSMIILSESGTELRIKDDGSYDLLKPGAADSIVSEHDKPFITDAGIKTADPVDIPAVAEDDMVVAIDDVKDEPKPVTGENTTDYVYTVYLFSSGAEDVAKEVNQRFQKAGHESRIITSGEEPSVRYRVAVPGFKSRQAAQKFSNSIVGKLGVSNTWIGKDRQNASSVDEIDVETASIAEIPEEAKSEEAEGDIVSVEDTATNATDSGSEEIRNKYIYTVYLFSTGSEDVANEVNQRFRQAGHQSKIITSGKEPSIRYRIAVSGFESRQSASEFSSSVIGKLGISDTWIGRERTDN